MRDRLGRIDTATLSDAMGRHGAMSHRMRPLDLDSKLVGTAVTAHCPEGDNLMVHKALQLGEPGDVLVVDTGGTYDATVLGRNMSLFAHRVGFVGAVIDGSVRDRSGIMAIPFPVFCVGIVPRSAVKHSVGSVNVPVTCGGVVVSPGDVIVGDEDGVVVVPRGVAEQVAEAAEARLRMEEQQKQDVQDEDLPLEILYGRTWVDERMRPAMAEPFQIPGNLDDGNRAATDGGNEAVAGNGGLAS
ncbi:RraA family protein [Micromonospora sp. WMMD998]|uniref:RraA family protein n=1 Tax=Micromonospora sp. WMMD998 TaxID=3016092 RepID=UPI00249A91A4|nr:RraA family protein [Micromonospora sp. WMMD998]WFE41105.1 RraA family protein [Micromonospora sp. WMMD998]